MKKREVFGLRKATDPK